jgi:hypothetical protein
VCSGCRRVRQNALGGQLAVWRLRLRVGSGCRRVCQNALGVRQLAVWRLRLRVATGCRRVCQNAFGVRQFAVWRLRLRVGSGCRRVRQNALGDPCAHSRWHSEVGGKGMNRPWVDGTVPFLAEGSGRYSSPAERGSRHYRAESPPAGLVHLINSSALPFL